MAAERRVGVKICGCHREEDVRAAVEAGADYVGFVFARSPRRVEPSEAARLARAFRGEVRFVGVFVDAPAEEVRAIAERVGLEVAQLHGGEPPGACRTLRAEGLEVWKALRPRSRQALQRGAARYGPAADGLLVEGFSRQAAGGTGTALPHDWLEGWREWVGAGLDPVPALVLAGGLHPGNVGSAVRSVRPDAVDVSSGVERSPGFKDPARIRRFVALAKGADLTIVQGGKSDG